MNLEQRLSKEYARYLVIRKLMKLERHPKYIMALEKVLIEMANCKNKNDEVFVTNNNHKYFNSIYHLVKYDFLSMNELKKLINKIILIINDFLIKKKFDLPKNYGNNDNSFYCGRFKKTINKERHNILLKVIDNKYKKDANKLILIALLRYECVISKFQHWNMPYQWYNYMYKVENVRAEGFSSPFHSQLLLIDSKVKYYSLFYDTDKYFGSLGNIFHTDLHCDNCNIILVPPHIKSVVKRTIKKSLNLLNKRRNLKLYLLCPEEPKQYEYLSEYSNLRKSKYRIFHTKLSKRQWYLENNMISEGKVKYYYGNELNVYVLGNKYEKKNYYSMVKQLLYIKKDDEEQRKYKQILEKEYNRYVIVQKIYRIGTGSNKYKNNEWANILERFLNSMANIKTNRIDQIFVHENMAKAIYNKMENELKDKRIDNYHRIVSEIKKMIDEYLNNKYRPINIVEYGQHDNRFYCNDFSKKIDNTRVISLLNRIGQVQKLQYYELIILILLLRYEGIFTKGQNWNFPFKWYDYIYQNYNVRLEGFASPLNSQLLLAGYDTKFCSLFKDTDNIFGSLGNLFDFDIEKYVLSMDNKRISIGLNPPYIVSIIDKMLDMIDIWFAKVKELRIFVGVPYWQDADFIKRLENHKYLKFKKVLGPHEYYYEDSTEEHVPKIYVNKEYETFVLSNFAKDRSEPNYESILQYFVPPQKE